MLLLRAARSLARVPGQTVGRKVQATRDAAHRGARCGVNLAGPAFKDTGAVVNLLRDKALTAFGLGSYTSGCFTFGTVE